MSSQSVSPTEDNRKNTIDDTMYSTLEGVVRNQEQTYDEFLNSFTYLKKDEINKQKSVEKSKKIGKTKTDVKKPLTTTDKERFGHKPAQTLNYEREEIEEETLCEGTTTSRLNSVKVIRTGAHVKVDNFVESEEITEDDTFTHDIEDIGPLDTYSASFCDRNASRQDHHSNQVTASNPPDPSELFNKLSLDENSTDKLLMNFLADLQNEENENNTRADRAGKPAEIGNALDIQAFLNKKSKKNKESSEDDVSFSDEESDGVLSLCENTNKTDVKVLLDQTRLKQIEVQSETRIMKDTYKAVLMDSEGNVTLGHSDEAADPDEEKEVDAKDIVFPGEITENERNEGDVNERLLDFKATYRVGNNIDTADQEPGSDLVQPFSLDENFDYDNVVLTPKYSAEDIERLMKSQPPDQQAVVM